MKKNEHTEVDSAFNDSVIRNFVESLRSVSNRNNRLGRALPEINEVEESEETSSVISSQ